MTAHDSGRLRSDMRAAGAGGVSRSLLRAAARDRRRILAARTDLEDRRARTRAELDDLDVRIGELDERVALLDRVLDPDIDDAEPRAGVRGCVLRGADIRRVAIAHLYAEHGADHPVHYRDWLSSLEHRGYVVLGQHPPATFLSSILRSPILARGRQPGTYFIEERRLTLLRDQLAQRRDELKNLSAMIATDAGAARSEPTDHRARLTAAVRRLERQVAESDASLIAHPSNGTPASRRSA